MHLGQGSQTALHFNGHHNLVSIVEELEATQQLGSATRILFAGSSGGGVGALSHADWLSRRLHSAYLRVAVQGAWMAPPITAYTTWMKGSDEPSSHEAQLEWSYATWAPFLDESCVSASQGAAHRCLDVPFAYSHVTTALHIAQNLFDTVQLYSGMGCPQSSTAINRAEDYAVFFAHQTELSLKEGRIHKGTQGSHDGLWAVSCLEHSKNLNMANCVRIRDPDKEGARTYRQALSEWFFLPRRDEGHWMIDSAERPRMHCNLWHTNDGSCDPAQGPSESKDPLSVLAVVALTIVLGAAGLIFLGLIVWMTCFRTQPAIKLVERAVDWLPGDDLVSPDGEAGLAGHGGRSFQKISTRDRSPSDL